VPSILRLATTPRWIALGLIALVFGAAALLLGRWQWDRTQDIVQAEQAARAEPVAIQALTDVGEDFDNPLIGRPVLADGRYDVARQTLVLNRELDGRPGVWVLTPLLLNDGSAIAVLRGWSENPEQLEPQTGSVAVAGIWHPNERFYRDEPFDSAGVYAISSERLRERWGLALRPGYIMLTNQSPQSALPTVPQTVRTADVPFPVQNAFYAVQWLVFAGFAGFVYFRWLRMEARSNLTS
jgi:cytochrome oxidase assembly protein ShyY1